LTLQPLGFGGILDLAFKIYTKHLGLLARTVAVVIVPVQLLAGVVLAVAVNDPDSLRRVGGSSGNEVDTGALVASAVGGIFGGIAFLIATAACVKAVAAIYLRAQPDREDSLRFATAHLPSLLWLGLLEVLLLIPATLALVIPGIWLAISWVLAFPVLLLEGVRGSDALRRSFRLVRRRWWPTFGILLVVGILAGVAQAIVGLPLAVLQLTAFKHSVVGSAAVQAIGNSIAGILVTPLQAATLVVLYFDLRLRKEGLDPAQVAERIGVPVPAEGPLGHYRQPWVPPGPQQGPPGPEAPPI
jgi:glycerophosphoryl diester phosphodiesterase family protein